jgi:hypothetical protein
MEALVRKKELNSATYAKSIYVQGLLFSCFTR